VNDLSERSAGQRPRDPDTSGGFYQPYELRSTALIAIGLHRIRCPLAKRADSSVQANFAIDTGEP